MMKGGTRLQSTACHRPLGSTSSKSQRSELTCIAMYNLRGRIPEELFPTEDKIEWVVRMIWNNSSGVPLGMQAEHLKGWLEEAQKAAAAAAEK